MRACPATTSAGPIASPKFEPIPGDVSLRLAGGTGGRVTGAIAMDGSLLYLGVGDQMQILDVRDPYAPKLLGTAGPFPADVEGVTVHAGLAAVAVGPAGLAVVDVTRPDAPALRGSVALPGYARAVALRDAFAVVADGPAGLRVVALSDPAKPVEVASVFVTLQALDVAVEGNTAYVAGAGTGLLIADLSDPSRPREAMTLDVGAYAHGIDAKGGLVFLANAWSGIATIDMTSPAAPKRLGTLATPGWALRMRVSGDRAYVASGAAGLQVADVSDPSKISLLGGEKGLDHIGVALAVRDGTAYLVEPESGLRILRMTGGSVEGWARYDPIGTGASVALSGGKALLAAHGFGARILDVRDPARLVETAWVPTAQRATAVAATSRAAYVFTEAVQDEAVWSIFPIDPTTGTASTPVEFSRGMPRDVTVQGDLLYAAVESGLHVVGTGPDGPCEMSFLRTFSFEDRRGIDVVTVAVSGSFAYLGPGTEAERSGVGLLVVDIGDPRHPSLAAQVAVRQKTGQARGLLAVGDTLFGAFGDILQVWSISDPRAPQLRAELVLPAAPGAGGGFVHGLAYLGGRLLVADGRAGVVAVDVSRPDRLRVAGRLRLPGVANAIATDDRRAYIASLDGGLLVVELAEPTGSVGPRPPQSALAPAARARSGAASTCVVSSRADSGSGTLRGCVEAARAGDAIRFDPAVFPPTAPASISLGGRIDVPGGVEVDARGAGVVLEAAAAGFEGLVLGSDSVVRGLELRGFSIGIEMHGSRNVVDGNVVNGSGDVGIEICCGPGASRNRIVGNLVGLDATGTRAVEGKATAGIRLTGHANQIGGPTAAERNVVAGGHGVGLSSKGSYANRIEGNYFGLDRSGARAIGGRADIYLCAGSGSNIVTGNAFVGLLAVCDPGSTFNEIVGNRMGTDASGRRAVGDGNLDISQPFTRVGGLLAGEGNVISDLLNIHSSDTIVIGNTIGVDGEGRPLGQGAVSLGDGATRNTIGGASAAERNVVAGGRTQGHLGLIGHSSHNVVMGNAFGMDRAGTRRLSDTRVVLGPSYWNFVVGNDLAAEVVTEDGAEANVIAGNRIH